MEDSAESKTDDADKDILGSSSSSLELKKVKPPNKKKHDDEIETVQNEIKEKESQLRLLTAENVPTQLKATRAEKLAVIEKLKKIDTDLKALSQQITKKKGNQDQFQSRLHYRSEDRIDEAIRRLEWQLKVQNFKLTEEKKIVAEIDSLKRSKKDLSQFLAAKKEVDESRDRQRRMRDERDRYQKNVNHLRNKEDELKRLNDERKNKVFVLKKEIDKLYTKKRHVIHEYKQQEKEYNEVKDEIKKQRKRDSFKRKEECKSHMEAFQNDIEEYGVQRDPYEDEIKLCNTLINYLHKFHVNEDEVEEPSKTPGVVDELDDGKYILLKKTEDNEYSSIRPSKRRPSKKGKKISVTKPITHAPQIFSQFASLTLNAPSTIAEILVSIEQIQARKKFYEEGGQISSQRVFTPSIEEHSASETGISATESAMCEMSRQASNTESTENPEVSFSVLDELVKLSGNDDNMSDKSEDTLARSNSDSTERAQSEGDNSDLSTPSQTDHESRKGSDFSETENSVLTQESVVSTDNRTQEGVVSTDNRTQESVVSTDNRKQESVVSTDNRTQESVVSTDNRTQESVVSIDNRTQENLVSTNNRTQESVVSTDNTELFNSPNSMDVNSKVVAFKKPIQFEDDKFPHLSNTDIVFSVESKIEDSRYNTEQGLDDSFVVIDNNSNIHDIKDSSNIQIINIQNEDNILFSTHL